MRKSWLLRFAAVLSAIAVGCGGNVRDAGQKDGTPEPSSKDAGNDGAAPAESGTGGSGPVTSASGGAATSAAGATATGGTTPTTTDGGYYGPLDCDGGCPPFTWGAFTSLECTPVAIGGAFGPLILRGCGFIGVAYHVSAVVQSTTWYEEATGTMVGIDRSGPLEYHAGQIPKCDFETCYTCKVGTSGKASLPLQCQGRNGLYPYDPRGAG